MEMLSSWPLSAKQHYAEGDLLQVTETDFQEFIPGFQRSTSVQTWKSCPWTTSRTEPNIFGAFLNHLLKHMLSATHGLEIALSSSTTLGSISQLAGLVCQVTVGPTKDFQQCDLWGIWWLIGIFFQTLIEFLGKLLNQLPKSFAFLVTFWG